MGKVNPCDYLYCFFNDTANCLVDSFVPDGTICSEDGQSVRRISNTYIFLIKKSNFEFYLTFYSLKTYDKSSF